MPEDKEDKPHWERFKKKIREYSNGRCSFDFQDGLPVLIIEIEGKSKNIDLTKDR